MRKSSENVTSGRPLLADRTVPWRHSVDCSDAALIAEPTAVQTTRLYRTALNLPRSTFIYFFLFFLLDH